MNKFIIAPFLLNRKIGQMLAVLSLFGFMTLSGADAATSRQAITTAQYATSQYHDVVITTLSEMVEFKTVAQDDIALENNPEFINFKRYLKQQARQLGFDYSDYGGVVVIGLGEGSNKLGIITHGDVQPADPDKWQQSPFKLDKTSEPGKLIARGTEDDKGAIATALYAMKAIKDHQIPLARRIELIISLTEESDWDPFRAFIKQHDIPQLNITIDASYPVVVAEKGWSAITLDFISPKQWQATANQPYISHFSGGVFSSQIPEDATAVLHNLSPSLIDLLKHRAQQFPEVKYRFTNRGSTGLEISASGASAHSASPQDGVNAIAYLAALLDITQWPHNDAGTTVNFINQQIGTGLYGEKFGDIAYQDDFMGPMTLALTVVKQSAQAISLNINIRRPVGKSKKKLEQQINSALTAWQHANKFEIQQIDITIGTPYMVKDAPHVKPLLDVFSHFTGIANPQPIAIGGSTNAKLLPNALSFGPSMPGQKYSGHSEHEFLTVEQLKLNLAMYTAMMIEIGNIK